MLKEALEKLEEMAASARTPTVRHIDGDRPDRVLIDVGGKWIWDDLDPGPRTLTTDSLAALCEIAVSDVASLRPAAIVYGFGFAEVIFNLLDADERLVWHPALTYEWSWFTRASESPTGRAVNVAEAVALFDLSLRETLGERAAAFLTSIGKLKILNEKTTEAQRDAVSSLVGGLSSTRAHEEGLPDGEQVFRVRPLRDGEMTQRYDLRALLRADLHQHAWTFFVPQSSIDRVRHQCADAIGDAISNHLGDAEVPVIRTRFEQDAAGLDDAESEEVE